MKAARIHRADLLSLTAAVGGMEPEMATQLKALEKENTRLRKMVAEQALELQILKGAGEENWQDLSP